MGEDISGCTSEGRRCAYLQLRDMARLGGLVAVIRKPELALNDARRWIKLGRSFFFGLAQVEAAYIGQDRRRRQYDRTAGDVLTETHRLAARCAPCPQLALRR